MSDLLAGDVIRTLAVLREMAEGKTITLPNGYTFGMAEDMTIGPVSSDLSGVLKFSEINLSSFHALLNKFEIGMPIPQYKGK